MRLTAITLTEVRRTACAATATVAAPNAAETTFLLEHIAALTPEKGNRAAFLLTSGMPTTLTALLNASAADFEVTSQALAQRLYLRMRARSRTTDCILAITATAPGQGPSNTISILKLDMDSSGAEGARNAAGLVTNLRLLTQLLPQPGRLAKAMVWPDPRGGAGAYVRDVFHGEPAAYFPEAYDLTIGTTMNAAELALVDVVRADPDPARRSAALAALDAYEGTVEGALDALREVEVPVPDELPDELIDAAVPVRATRALRRRVRLQADWLTVTVPIDHEDDVDVTDNEDGTWTVSATVGARPARSVN
jgi:hypothetical protein